MPIIYAMLLGRYEVDYSTIMLLESQFPPIREATRKAILQELKFQSTDEFEVRLVKDSTSLIEVWSREIRTVVV